MRKVDTRDESTKEYAHWYSDITAAFSLALKEASLALQGTVPRTTHGAKNVRLLGGVTDVPSVGTRTWRARTSAGVPPSAPFPFWEAVTHKTEDDGRDACCRRSIAVGRREKKKKRKEKKRQKQSGTPKSRGQGSFLLRPCWLVRATDSVVVSCRRGANKTWRPREGPSPWWNGLRIAGPVLFQRSLVRRAWLAWRRPPERERCQSSFRRRPKYPNLRGDHEGCMTLWARKPKSTIRGRTRS